MRRGGRGDSQPQLDHLAVHREAGAVPPGAARWSKRPAESSSTTPGSRCLARLPKVGSEPHPAPSPVPARTLRPQSPVRTDTGPKFELKLIHDPLTLRETCEQRNYTIVALGLQIPKSVLSRTSGYQHLHVLVIHLSLQHRGEVKM